MGDPGPGKANSLFSLINHQPDIGKIYLFAKDINEARYQVLLKKHEVVEAKHFNDSKAFIEYSNDVKNIFKNVAYNPNKYNPQIKDVKYLSLLMI